MISSSVVVAHYRAICDPISCDNPYIRHREKGVLAKGVSAGFRRRELKVPKHIGPSSTFGARSATAKRGMDICKDPLLKTPSLQSPFAVIGPF